MLISRALKKYGHENFSIEILEYCSVENLLKREQYYIDLSKPEYNILQKAGSSLGYKHTEETKAKMSTAQIGEKH
jgi:group I intron endonuclease